MMGVSAKHALDPSPTENTGVSFILGYLSSRLLFFLNGFLNMYHMKEFAQSMMVENLYNFFLMCLFVPLFVFLPVSGNTSHEYIKLILWALIALLTIVGQVIPIIIPSHFKNRLAVNFDHLSDRLGLLVVIGIIFNNF
jgi:low temperature requirement protein LtrA